MATPIKQTLTTWPVESIRNDFPILNERVQNKPLVYLDNAATTHKPLSVLKTLDDFYRHTNSNIHRSPHDLGQKATELFEGARQKVAAFLGVTDDAEIIFTRGTTESINLVAATTGKINVESGDTILVMRSSHHSHYLPWAALAQDKNAKLRVIELEADTTLSWSDYREALKLKPKIVALTSMSNVLGTQYPIAAMAQEAHDVGAMVVVDYAQSIAHEKISITELGPIDFLAFSGHKVFGPTGIGVLWGKRDWLEKMPPYQWGGHMIALIREEALVLQDIPHKFEAGTSPIAEAIGLGAAFDYFDSLPLELLSAYEKNLHLHFMEKWSTLKNVKLFGSTSPENRGPVYSFVVDGIHPHDIATVLNQEGIAIRAGHHCAQPLHQWFKMPATNRVSFSIYNTHQEMDHFFSALQSAQEFFEKR